MGSAGQMDPQPVFVNKVLLAHDHAHSFTYCVCLLLCYEGRDSKAENICSLQSGEPRWYYLWWLE